MAQADAQRTRGNHGRPRFGNQHYTQSQDYGYNDYSEPQYYYENSNQNYRGAQGSGGRGAGRGSYQTGRGRGRGAAVQRPSQQQRPQYETQGYQNPGLPENFYGNVNPDYGGAEAERPRQSGSRSFRGADADYSHEGRRGTGRRGGQRGAGGDNWQRNTGRRLGEGGNVVAGVAYDGEAGHPQNAGQRQNGSNVVYAIESQSAPLAVPASIPSAFVPRMSHRAPGFNGDRSGRGGSRPKLTRNEDKNQRERLTEELTKERLECQFCFDRLWAKQPTWSCDNCFNVFHLKCVRGWANSCKKDSEDGAWRCMICQTVFLEEPKKYQCFCRKHENPEYNPSLTPHTCGELCEKSNEKFAASRTCEHVCTELCHPGPCPPCQRLVTRSCACGKTHIREQCSSASVQLCSSSCDKILDCGKHRCPGKCHLGPCNPCDIKVEVSCFCGQDLRTVSCVESSSVTYREGFSCGSVCDRMLECGNHRCGQKCHQGNCLPCGRSPGLVKFCPCGKTSLDKLGAKPRKSCLEAIETCGAICGKELVCGTAKSRHFCGMACHDGPCPPCDKKTALPCACGSSTQMIACSEITPENRVWTCKKRCQKKMLCGRHKCENICCNFDEHVCLKSCGKKLTCGLHNCEDPCGHPGFCRRCYNTSFEERTCRCGFTVQLPPIPCGAPLPDCPKPCTLPHPCGHPPTHSCHAEEQCPPCTFLCEKACFGGHETRRNLPCYTAGVSCGKPCGRGLNCGVHFCRKICHSGECENLGEKCVQPCTLLPRKCGHPCNVHCHGQTKCPFSSCKSVVTVTCECHLKQKKVPCYQIDKLVVDYIKRQHEGLLGTKPPTLESLRHAMPTDILECDDECRKVERNKSLAAALDIEENRETAVLAPIAPVYSEELRQFARENARWATQIENSLHSLVESVRKAGARRLHTFQPMRHEQRKFLYELAEFYGCDTQSQDEGPLKTVVASGRPDRVMMPASSLYSVVAAERPLKQVAKFPTSVLRGLVDREKVNVSEREKVPWPTSLPEVGFERENKFAALQRDPPKPVIDYFDMTES